MEKYCSDCGDAGFSIKIYRGRRICERCLVGYSKNDRLKQEYYSLVRKFSELVSCSGELTRKKIEIEKAVDDELSGKVATRKSNSLFLISGSELYGPGSFGETPDRLLVQMTIAYDRSTRVYLARTYLEGELKDEWPMRHCERGKLRVYIERHNIGGAWGKRIPWDLIHQKSEVSFDAQISGDFLSPRSVRYRLSKRREFPVIFNGQIVQPAFDNVASSRRLP